MALRDRFLPPRMFADPFDAWWQGLGAESPPLPELDSLLASLSSPGVIGYAGPQPVPMDRGNATGAGHDLGPTTSLAEQQPHLAPMLEDLTTQIGLAGLAGFPVIGLGLNLGKTIQSLFFDDPTAGPVGPAGAAVGIGPGGGISTNPQDQNDGGQGGSQTPDTGVVDAGVYHTGGAVRDRQQKPRLEETITAQEGEFVVARGPAKKHRKLLERINAGATKAELAELLA